MIEQWYRLICDHCGHQTSATKGQGEFGRNKSMNYTPNSPLWATGLNNEDVCWYCINNGVPWRHAVTGVIYYGPFAEEQYATPRY